MQVLADAQAAGAVGVHPPAQVLGDLDRTRERGLRQHRRELLAAVATELVIGTQTLLQDAGEIAQHRVAGEVTVGVVHFFEVIDVDHQQ